MSYKKIMEIVPTIQSVHLISENLKALKKKKMKSKDIIGLGAKNIVGTSLIKIEADLISDL
jgi:hypothetical protein